MEKCKSMKECPHDPCCVPDMAKEELDYEEIRRRNLYREFYVSWQYLKIEDITDTCTSVDRMIIPVPRDKFKELLEWAMEGLKEYR